MLDNTWCKKEKIQSEIQIGNQYFSEISISLALYKLTVVPFRIAEALERIPSALPSPSPPYLIMRDC